MTTKTKELLNGTGRNILLLVIAALLGYMTWSIEDMKQDVKRNTAAGIECKEGIKYFKDKVMEHESDLYEQDKRIDNQHDRILNIEHEINIRGVTTSKEHSTYIQPAADQ